MRRSLAALAGMLALVAAGCGGGGGGGGGQAALPDAASVVPASAPILVTINSDFSSDQWQKVAALFSRFPDGGALLAQLKKQLPKGVTLPAIKAAIGPEVDVAVLSLETGAPVVFLTNSKRPDKLGALLDKDTTPSVHEQAGGWTAITDKRVDLDRFDKARKGGTLDGSSAFKDALKEAPADAEATVYVNGKAVQDRLEEALATSGVGAGAAESFGTLDWFVASVSAKDDGISISGDAHGSLKNQPASYHPALPDELPSGALAYVSFSHLDRPLKQILDLVKRSLPGFDTQLRGFEGVTGLSLEGDILPIFSGEGALVVYPSEEKTKGLSIPGIAFVEKVSDESKVRSLLGRLASIAALSGGTVKATQTTVAGVAAQKFEYEGVAAYAAVFDGKLVLTNAQSIISGMHGGSRDKLAGDAVYKQAADAAGLPSNVLGLVYVNLRDVLPAAFALAEETGATVPKAARDNTAPLQSTLVYATADGNDYRLGGFVTIK